jgi:hypothetical protein
MVLRFLCVPLPEVTVVFQMTVREPLTGALKCVLNTPVFTTALIVLLPDGCAMALSADLICVEETTGVFRVAVVVFGVIVVVVVVVAGVVVMGVVGLLGVVGHVVVGAVACPELPVEKTDTPL